MATNQNTAPPTPGPYRLRLGDRIAYVTIRCDESEELVGVAEEVIKQATDALEFATRTPGDGDDAFMREAIAATAFFALQVANLMRAEAKRMGMPPQRARLT
jgi:hypothetical protein